MTQKILIEKNKTVTIHNRASTSLDYVIQENAHVIFIDKHNHSSTEDKIIIITFRLAAGSRLNYFLAYTGGQHCTLHLNILLLGKHAHATINGVYVLNKNQQLCLHTRQEHHAPNTHSTLHINGIVADTAQAQYEGTIFVGRDAHKTIAKQKNKNLLLNRGARVHSAPKLNVLTKNVQCSHGCAVGQVDKEQLFYVKSRGLSDRSAVQLLLMGFIASLLNQPEHKQIRKILQQKIERMTVF